MKKLLLFATIFVASAFNALAYDFSAVSPSGHTLYYNIVNGHAEVVRPGYLSSYPTDLSGNLIIPESVLYNNITYSVTILADLGDLGTFQGCSNLTSVSIPSTITVIESNTFRDCYALSSISIPSSVTSLGHHSFWNCTSLMSVYFSSSNPPSINSTAFANTPSDKVFFVPCNYLQNYTDTWGISYNIQCYNTLVFYLTINSNDSIWGTGSYVGLSDSIAEITATPNYGYHFDHWSFGSSANPDTVMLTDDTTITAIFAKNQYSVSGVTNDSTKGLVSGSATVDYLDSVSLIAIANHGYQFIRWSDYSAENPRRIAATANITKTAIFDFNQYNLTVHADTSIHGYCNGSGSYNYLSERTISANASYGYHFTQWNDGNTDNPRVITLTQDTAFNALFAKNQYTLTVSSNDTTLGSVAGSGTYEYLDTIAISATAIEHYHFVRWDDGNTLNPRNIIMTSDISRSAIFAIDTHSVTLQAGNITHGSYSGNGQYQYGTAATVEALPYSGYQFSHWNNGSTYNPYTFAVVNDVQLTAHFYAVGTPYQDTLYLDTLTIHDSIYLNVYVHDTTFLTQYIHDTLIQTVTQYVHDTTFINNYIHDTTYLDRYIYEYLHDTIMQYINNYIHDTTYINNYIHDTAYINNYIHDTTYVHDTTIVDNYIHDTIYLDRYIYDTIYIHDTIYIQGEGIEDIALLNAKIYQRNGQIVVEGAEGNPVYLYDVVGRLLATKRETAQEVLLDVPASGVYLVKIGDAPARRIVVKR